jgi:hypothetical protein
MKNKVSIVMLVDNTANRKVVVHSLLLNGNISEHG